MIHYMRDDIGTWEAKVADLKHILASTGDLNEARRDIYNLFWGPGAFAIDDGAEDTP